MAQTTSAGLSKLLCEARELVEMYADIVEARTGGPADWPRRVVREIDVYRAERGWNPHGFGGEDDNVGNVIRLEFEFHADSRDADLTRLSDALAALEAMGVIVRQTQLGFRAPYPEESDRGSMSTDGEGANDEAG